MVNHVGVGVAVELSGNLSACHHAALKVIVLRLGCILPPGVYACGQQTLTEVLPVGCGCIGIEKVYPVSAVNIVTGGVHLTANLAVLVYLGPYGEHEFHVHAVKLIGHGFGIGVLALVELHGVPAVFAPPLPVLDNHAGVVTLVIKTVGVLQEFLLAVIALAAVYVTECPVRHLRNLTGQVAV